MTQHPSRALSLSALTVLELTPPQMVECAAQAGYDFVGLRLVPATDHEVRHEHHRRDAVEARNAWRVCATPASRCSTSRSCGSSPIPM